MLATTSSPHLLLLTTNPGLESIVADEFRQLAAIRGLPSPQVELRPFGCGGQVIVHSAEGGIETALCLRSIHHVLHLLYRFDLSDESNPVEVFADAAVAFVDTVSAGNEDLPIAAACPEIARIYRVLRQHGVGELDAATSFRVTTKRSGAHPFTSMDVQRFAGGALLARHQCAVDLLRYEVDVRVDVIEQTCIVGIQLSRHPLSKRITRARRPRAALSANVAYALLHLAGVDDDTRCLLDPFCGSGTILLEAADLHPRLQLVGSDYNTRALVGTRRNVDSAGHGDRVALCCCDARRMAAVYGRTFDAIVTNPPFGILHGQRIDFDGFYHRLLEQAAALLRPRGRLALLSWKRGVIDRVNRRQGLFRRLHTRVVETGGIYPRIYVMEKREPTDGDHIR